MISNPTPSGNKIPDKRLQNSPFISQARWGAVILAACIIAPASEFVHGYMLDWLGVPYPKEVGLPIWASVVGLTVRLLAVAILARLAAPALKRRSPFLLACASGLIMVMLNETLRVIIIERVILDSWPYAMLDNAPKAICTFLEVSIVAYASLRGARWPNLLAIIIPVAVIGTAFVAPWLTDHLGHWRDTHFGDVKQHYTDPYPPKVTIIIYTTFIEATFAAFVLAAMCWENLPGGTFKRTVAFTLLLLLVRGRVVSLLLQSFWVHQPLPVAFLSEGQFFLETMTLGLLVGAAWGLWRPYHSPVAVVAE